MTKKKTFQSENPSISCTLIVSFSFIFFLAFSRKEEKSTPEETLFTWLFTARAIFVDDLKEAATDLVFP